LLLAVDLALYLGLLVLLAQMAVQAVLVVGQEITQLALPEYLVKETLVDFQVILLIMVQQWLEEAVQVR
jgi:hypothetical protein